ncbi:hypothetical protein [Phytoactinopolyspora halotolerans]|uniref:GH26 domain-containing protein n=1 Tax=Phytoactinopolyspora halotolerans TaxID=1981512 RepID=A0A6L9SGJ7_9ACTN|nr:hypothetical protein [Phytoactinopolyspora halotolerans]NEE04396.1 hypothetical protein [Phytoactinopolyspora halotolerans]
MARELTRRTAIVSMLGAAGAVATAPHLRGGIAAHATTLPPYVGCAAGRAGAYDPQEEWDKAQRDLGGGKLTYRRAFDSTIPSPGGEAWRDADAPAHFYSVKPPGNDIQGFIDGRYDDRLRALVRDLPNGTKFTMYHEPEDNMSGQTFYQMFRRLYDVVNDERPRYVQVWYVAMAYQWQTNSKGNVGTNDGWIDAARLADGVGIDVYAPDWDFTAIEDDGGYQRWRNLIAEPSGRPWGVIERGISGHAGESARRDMLSQDWEFAKANESKFFLYWQSDRGGDWLLLGPAEQAYHRTMADEGRQIGT